MKRDNFLRVLAGCVLAALTLLILATPPAYPQSDYPNRPIRILVGFAPGGGNDIFARLVGAKVSEILGQPVVIENKPGGSGRLAAEFAARQAPDGYTLMVAPSGAMSVAAAIYPDLAYRPLESFVPLAMTAIYPLIVTVSANHPAKTIKELVEFGKQHPDKANYASVSPSFTIATELFKLNTGLPGVMIPYKSSNEMILSLMNGQAMYTVVDGPVTIPQVQAGTVRALAVTGSEPLPELPNVPTMAAIGYPEVDSHLWSGVFAIAGTSPAIIAKLQKAINEAIRDPAVSEKLRNMAVTPGGGPPDEFRSLIAAEIIKYTKIVKAANLHFEE